MIFTSLASLSLFKNSVRHDKSFIFVFWDKKIGHLGRILFEKFPFLSFIIEGLGFSVPIRFFYFVAGTMHFPFILDFCFLGFESVLCLVLELLHELTQLLNL